MGKLHAKEKSFTIASNHSLETHNSALSAHSAASSPHHLSSSLITTWAADLVRRIAPNGNLAVVNGIQSLGLMKKSLFERILSYSHEHYLRYTNKKNPITKGAIIYLYNSYPPLKVI